jgi:hypothetical protein
VIEHWKDLIGEADNTKERGHLGQGQAKFKKGEIYGEIYARE